MISTSSIALSRIKEKCRIIDSAQDSAITNTIAEVTPVVSLAIQPEALASTDAGVSATISLAITEIVCAEVLEERVRDAGILTGSIGVDPGTLVLKTADRLRHRGWGRLRPFLRTSIRDAPVRVSAISVGT